MKWFVHCGVVGFFTAYLATHPLVLGTSYLHVLCVVGSVAFMSN